MSANETKPSTPFIDSWRTIRRYESFLSRINTDSDGVDNLSDLAEIITPEHPLVYWSMEIYDDEENDIKGGGGLGVLAADTRRQAEHLGIPLVVMTPFYTEASHQEVIDFWQHERHEKTDPNRLYAHLGRVSVSTVTDPSVPLDVYGRDLGSTRILTVTEPGFGELYPGSNSGDHRLYQEVALGFGGYKVLKEQGIEAPFMQLNEAPTVFAAIAHLDDLITRGNSFEDAFTTVRKQMLYTNHTLVQAVEGMFSKGQFEQLVLPNIKNQEVKDWLHDMFGAAGNLRLSDLAVELAEVKSGVSKLHARVSDFKDRNNKRVTFEAVTNGVSDKWIMDGAMDYYRSLGALDEFDLPTDNLKEKLSRLSIEEVRDLKQEGRRELNDVLEGRLDQYGNDVSIPADALIFDFKRRFANYKRPDMIFSDPMRLAFILESTNSHFILTGKPHPNDEPMKGELYRILDLIDGNTFLRDRVHYIQDYDEELGRALAVGADCAINIPVVGQEACGTSWMKDIANFKILISTPDGGVADIEPIECLEVSGDENEALYKAMEQAATILRDDDLYREEVIREVSSYLPVISGSRMMGEYLQLFNRMHRSASAPTITNV